MEEETQTFTGAPLEAVLVEDLTSLGLEELNARIAALEAEIARCRSVIDDKKSLHSDAEAIFQK